MPSTTFPKIITPTKISKTLSLTTVQKTIPKTIIPSTKSRTIIPNTIPYTLKSTSLIPETVPIANNEITPVIYNSKNNGQDIKNIVKQVKNEKIEQIFENDNKSNIKLKINKKENQELIIKSKQGNNNIFKKNFNYSLEEINSNINISKKYKGNDKRHSNNNIEIENSNKNRDNIMNDQNKIGKKIEYKKAHLPHPISFENKFDTLIDELRKSNNFMFKIVKQNRESNRFMNQIVLQNNILINEFIKKKWQYFIE